MLGNQGAQALEFNPIFLSADANQFWLLLGVVGFYFLPFLAAALFLGSAFLIGADRFGRVYFADLMGAGLAGFAFLAALAVVPPEHILFVPLALWLLSCLAWSLATGWRLLVPASLGLAALAIAVSFGTQSISTLALQGASPMRAISRMRSASTRIGARRAIWRSIRAPISISRPASRTWPRSTCRACRRMPISGSISTATARPGW